MCRTLTERSTAKQKCCHPLLPFSFGARPPLATTQMEKPIPLETLFNKKIFRIPDYQRGYAWQKEQLQAFWEDLVNLPEGRSHYTGVLTLRELPTSSIARDSREFWLVDGHSYKLYHVVDGQQRLTTFVIFVQTFAELFARLPENFGKSPSDVYVTDYLRLSDLHELYLFRTNPRVAFRTYMFGYTTDNPSHDYLRHRILGENDGGTIQETFYTLNLGDAKEYFSKQLESHFANFGKIGLIDLYNKLTKRFLFNEYAIDDDFDVFVAFETMNNRGKKLSDLELLKNRLIYLTTLFDDPLVDEAGRKALRDEINAAWKETYHQLGRNKSAPLNDDDYLRALWIAYFKYSRDTGRDYASFLLDRYFSPRNVHETLGIDVPFGNTSERRVDDFEDDLEEQEPDSEQNIPVAKHGGKIGPADIRDFVSSLKESARHWFASFYPELSDGMSRKLISSVDGLNRIGMGYFRPLVMVVLKKSYPEDEKLRLFAHIERFVLLAFRVGTARSNYRSSEFYNVARALDRGETDIDTIVRQLDTALTYAFNDDGSLRIDEFHGVLIKKFKEGSGYYGWSGLRYLLFEYEQSLLDESRQRKGLSWSDLLRPGNDKVSIEHVYPQTPTDEGWPTFADVPTELRPRYNGSLGNLLLLSMSINASLQNDSFASKKAAKYDADGKKIRNGYEDGSHSEIEVSRKADWGPTEIHDRGIRILKFMEKRWDFRFRDTDREKLLFLDHAESVQPM